MKKHIFLAAFLGLSTAVACGGGGDEASGDGDGDGDGDATTGGTSSGSEGSEGGPCYGNGTCDAGLSCASDLCVSLGGGTGGADPGTGGNGSGATSTGGTGTGGDGTGGDSGSGGDTGCNGGTCPPALGACFTEIEFATCDEACAAGGEVCVPDACSDGGFDRTALGWTLSTAADCETATDPRTSDNGACDTPLSWEAGTTVKRCCCTDTQ